MDSKNENSSIPDGLLRRYSDFRGLGSGAMGEVYCAHDSILDIDVAIKLLKMRQFAPEMAVRFQQEAKVASKLKHHNLVTLLDFGISETGEPYIIMEYVKGQSLATILEEHGALPIPVAFNILIQICDGMENAHRSGIVHRDLKPSNVMITGEDLTTATVKVLDFGIAKQDGAAGSVTHTGTLLGTPYYMSPEQFSGENVDRRSDVYAAGSILFCLLTHTLPFESESLLEITQLKREYEAPRLTEIAAGANLPHEVEEVVAKALAKEPDERYQSMKELKEALLLARERIHIKLEQVVPLKPEKTSFFTPKRMKFYGTVIASASLVTLIFGAVFYFKVFENKVQLVEAEQPPERKDPRHNPITDKVFEVSGGTWTATGTVYDRDMLWLADHKSDLTIKSIVLGVSDATTVQNQITQKGWAAVAKLPLTNLTLTNCFISDEDMKYLAKIDTLRTINLTRSGVGDKGIAKLKNRPITEITLRSLPITDACIDSLATMNLHKVSFEETGITNAGYEKISKIKTIDWLNISATKGTADGLIYLAAMPKLREVHAGTGPFGLQGVKNLSKLKLRVFSAESDKTFDDVCLNTVFKQWPKLEVLHIDNTSISAEGLKNIGKLHYLKSLSLNTNGLKDDALKPLKDLPNLENLNVSLNAITDKTAEFLVTLPRLRYVDVSHCAITQKGLEVLKKRKINYLEVTVSGQSEANEVMTDLWAGNSDL
jgi:serine/threonine protein kinase